MSDKIEIPSQLRSYIYAQQSITKKTFILWTATQKIWWLKPILAHYLLLILAILLPYYNNFHEGVTLEHFKHALINWDSLWYIEIAENGYESRKATAFFPFVPILIKVFGNPYTVIAVTQVAFLFAYIYWRNFSSAVTWMIPK